MKGASQMEISFISKNKAIQPQNIQEQKSDPAKNIDTEENKKYILKNKLTVLKYPVVIVDYLKTRELPLPNRQFFMR